MAASHVAAHHETAHHETVHETAPHEIAHHDVEHHEIAHRETPAVEMPTERATQIQTALIKQGYLTGEPTGMWDAQTVSAMQKLQADNGWQSKITPDSRALIKLGLGPEVPGPGPDQPHNIAQTQPQ
jgi:peptidoglycan hydrolase-like protein with peptidoglycan-binding domain